MSNKIILTIALMCFCYAQENSNYENNANPYNPQNQTFNNSPQGYMPQPLAMDYTDMSDEYIMIGGFYGYGILKPKRNLYGGYILSNLSSHTFVGIEAMQLKAIKKGDLTHKDSLIVGKNTSYMANMLFGFRFKPLDMLGFSGYVGSGSTIKYSSIASISTFTSGIDISFIPVSFIGISFGYKNIVLLLQPKMNIEHYATANIKIIF